MAIPVMRFQRNKTWGDENTPLLYYLKRVPGHERTYTEKDLAEEIEITGAMSAEDVTHVLSAVKRSMKTILTRGDKVKIDGLGTFFTTFSTIPTEEEKDCTVRNIHKVNIRFKVDNTLRLVNDSNASTRGSANNVEFYIKSDAVNTSGQGEPSGGGEDNGDPLG